MNAQQQLLFPELLSPAEREILDAELDLLRSCPSLERLSEEQVKFAILFQVADPEATMETIADRAGISRAQAYRYRRDPAVCAAMTQLAQQLCDVSSIRLSTAVAHLLDSLASKIMHGGHQQLTPSEQWLVQLALRRAGIDGGARMSLKFTTPDGSSAEASIDGGPALDDVMTRLERRRAETAAAACEHDLCDNVSGCEGSPAGDRPALPAPGEGGEDV